MKTSDLDAAFDAGEDIGDLLEIKNARRIHAEQRRVNVDFPVWMIASLDREATRIGVTRQSLIKLWLADKLQHTQAAL